ncbi:demethylmenaquinone methyltransferase [Halalkalibacterium halodurans]|uniref:Demethylmenaquinone methyltransferase n=1 Tax=Halalkalibacterium halodurans (strain ATCC BAA-125 / DSM 18197 / FERM 7344 / JCM 9153 / C-125) TaxID=272558 RepID=MENG_HALH5|nr:demethylmenaquinone methyltransferase [Halalkalibacterium halodurans]Q9KCC4.1 RecName: Full=Demethylmenaquinone methyltransferase [Halalkalibacterium halodurans C-125]MED4081374.1 demethylmenaquinone methyltransferase [Halalkalibacterium halodurans]MED4086913.1 demethylmenaquinone methyltransferase [Halalkalibacterium halodurans]MED4104312.1 demethylmenaquinone methyltransferase [Halalkalibacterium halodurans]MED4109225.1 demethylmenaquinone methyltransferase [Halalkalibacterium halodurans]
MTETKEERVHQVFEKIYKRYDVMNSVISFQRHKAWRKDTMKRMNVQEGQSALDVCCGTADWAIALGKAVGPTGHVEGLDFSENMLSIGKKKIADERLDHVFLRHGNAMELPYADDTFDFVTIGFGLRNVPDYMQVLREMARVTKPGGKVVCLETSQPTIPVFKQLYFFYFRHVMPLFGKMFAKSYDEYSWLQESTLSFPGRDRLAQMFKEVGLTDVQVKPYSGGAAAMHLGVKESYDEESRNVTC